jgi:ferritin-like metal-binding protein YciE
MGLLSSGPNFETLHDLFVNQLQDMYDAEHRIHDALPKMQDAAKSTDLRAAFAEHASETKIQIERLEQAFAAIGEDAKRETCQATKGLIEEGEEALNASGDDDVQDAALIASANRVEHYEIAGYGTLASLARRLGHHEVASLMETSLDEEKNADSKLTAIATSKVNAAAASA